MWFFIHKLSSPKSFYRLISWLLPWCIGISIILMVLGLYFGLLVAPADYQQGDAYRIMYIHVPSAILSLMLYALMAVSAIFYWIWKIKIADVLAKVTAPVGAWLTFLALVTGALWGKPMWGTYWIWDARLTSELILLFLFFGVIALRGAIDDEVKAARASAILAIIGIIDVPIIHYSVYWWNSLHQKDSISFFSQSTIAPSMLHPLLLMIFGFIFLSAVFVMQRAKVEILTRENKATWVRELLK